MRDVRTGYASGSGGMLAGMISNIQSRLQKKSASDNVKSFTTNIFWSHNVGRALFCSYVNTDLTEPVILTIIFRVYFTSQYHRMKSVRSIIIVLVMIRVLPKIISDCSNDITIGDTVVVDLSDVWLMNYGHVLWSYNMRPICLCYEGRVTQILV